MSLLVIIALCLTAGTAPVTFLALRRDIGAGRAAAAAAGTGVVVGVAWFFIVYLAVVAWLAALASYVLARRLLPTTRAALLTAAGAFTAVVLASTAAFTIALSTM